MRNLTVRKIDFTGSGLIVDLPEALSPVTPLTGQKCCVGHVKESDVNGVL